MSFFNILLYFSKFLQFVGNKVPGLTNFQKLQCLASIQQQKFPLDGLSAANFPNTAINSPLNSSLSSSVSPTLNTELDQSTIDCNLSIATALASCFSGGLSDGCSPQILQFILASGQLLQGLQAAQLLIPTPQGNLQVDKKIKKCYNFPLLTFGFHSICPIVTIKLYYCRVQKEATVERLKLYMAFVQKFK